MTTSCPYCGVALDPLPKAKKRCPACRQPIYVRSAPDGLTYLLRDLDLEAHEARWDAYHERRDWIRAAEPFVDEAGFEAIERELAAKGPGYRPRDAYWLAANMALLALLPSAKWDLIQTAYWSMARAAYEEADTDAMPERAVLLAREALKAQLRSYAPGRVEILPCDCDRCSRDIGAADIRREIEKPRIPHADCREGWCSCDYLPVVD